jgi:hypothetical protein
MELSHLLACIEEEMRKRLDERSKSKREVYDPIPFEYRDGKALLARLNASGKTNDDEDGTYQTASINLHTHIPELLHGLEDFLEKNDGEWREISRSEDANATAIVSYEMIEGSETNGKGNVIITYSPESETSLSIQYEERGKRRIGRERYARIVEMLRATLANVLSCTERYREHFETREQRRAREIMEAKAPPAKGYLNYAEDEGTELLPSNIGHKRQRVAIASQENDTMYTGDVNRPEKGSRRVRLRFDINGDERMGRKLKSMLPGYEVNTGDQSTLIVLPRGEDVMHAYAKVRSALDIAFLTSGGPYSSVPSPSRERRVMAQTQR